MRKKVTLSLVLILVIAIILIIVYILQNSGHEASGMSQVSSAYSFGADRDNENYDYYIFSGDSNIRSITECYIKCDIKSGGLVLAVYDNNGYSHREKDNFKFVREEVITQSGEYYFDFTDLPEGIYTFFVTPQNIGDNVYFEYTCTLKGKD